MVFFTGDPVGFFYFSPPAVNASYTPDGTVHAQNRPPRQRQFFLMCRTLQFFRRVWQTAKVHLIFRCLHPECSGLPLLVPVI